MYTLYRPAHIMLQDVYRSVHMMLQDVYRSVHIMLQDACIQTSSHNATRCIQISSHDATRCIQTRAATIWIYPCHVTTLYVTIWHMSWHNYRCGIMKLISWQIMNEYTRHYTMNTRKVTLMVKQKSNVNIFIYCYNYSLVFKQKDWFISMLSCKATSLLCNYIACRTKRRSCTLVY